MTTDLFVFAHPDDETLAASVAIAEHVAAGHEVYLLWMTAGESSGVRAQLNGSGVNTWWGLAHNPVAEGYAPLDPIVFGAARAAEGVVAARSLAAGLAGTLTLHQAGLPDGGVSVDSAYEAILTRADLVAPGSPVRLKTHTWVPTLDGHPDHLACGSAIRQMAMAIPERFADCRFYVLPSHWSDPDLPTVSWSWDNPSDDGIAKRAINACRAYGAWHPPDAYAVGMHSVPSQFSAVMATPRSLYHS